MLKWGARSPRVVAGPCSGPRAPTRIVAQPNPTLPRAKLRQVNSRGGDEDMRPGQVAALRRRIELLTPTYDRLALELKRTIKATPAVSGPQADKAASDKASRQLNRLRIELDAIGSEIETLRALVAARLGRSER